MGKAVTLLVRNANDQATMARTESPRVCSWSYLNSFLSVVDTIYGDWTENVRPELSPWLRMISGQSKR